MHKKGLGLQIWRWCLSAASAGETANSARQTKTRSIAQPKQDTRKYFQEVLNIWIVDGRRVDKEKHCSPIHHQKLCLCLRWAKDRRVVLVSSHERKKWTTVRPLPTKKPIPSQFEVCVCVFFLFCFFFTPKALCLWLKQIFSNAHQILFFS